MGWIGAAKTAWAEGFCVFGKADFWKEKEENICLKVDGKCVHNVDAKTGFAAMRWRSGGGYGASLRFCC
jgi:hypothetical protein